MATPPRRTIVYDARALIAPDARTVGSLARAQLRLRRLGFELRISHPPHELRELLAFMGLLEALSVEPCGEAEDREQRLGVEEEGQFDDPAA
jgi:hypothetical protein